MKNGLRIAAVAALALGVAACGGSNNGANNATAAGDNMLVPTDNAAVGTGTMGAMDNGMGNGMAATGTMAGNTMAGGNAMAGDMMAGGANAEAGNAASNGAQ